MFPKCVLSKVDVTESDIQKRKQNQKQAQYTKHTLEQWKTDEGRRELWVGLSLRKPPHLSTKKWSQEEANVRRCNHLVKCGRLGNALEALISNGVRKVNQEVINELRRKHPEASLPTRVDETDTEPIQVDMGCVSSQLKSFPRDTACGRDGLRADHLKEMIQSASYEMSIRLQTSLTSFVNCCLKGNLPVLSAPYVASAPVTPLEKKNGGIRPIAVGETLRRLVSKCASSMVVKNLHNHFHPHQMGVGTRDGGVGILHAINRAIQKHGDDSTLVMLKVDFENAFNLVSRSRMFEEVKRVCPGLLKWVQFCYSTHPFLYEGDVIFESCQGVQQGDPLGPLLFALTLMPLVKKIAAKYNLLVNAWYLDDGSIIGKADEVVKVFNLLMEEGPEYGLILNQSKCEIWWPSTVAQYSLFPSAVIRIEEEGVDLLGALLGSSDFANRITMIRVSKIEKLLEKTQSLDHPLHQLLLLRYCTGMPRFGYALRTGNPLAIQEAIRSFDAIIDKALLSIIGKGLDAKRRALAGLPVRMGGLGIPRAEDIAASAFLGP